MPFPQYPESPRLRLPPPRVTLPSLWPQPCPYPTCIYGCVHSLPCFSHLPLKLLSSPPLDTCPYYVRCTFLLLQSSLPGRSGLEVTQPVLALRSTHKPVPFCGSLRSSSIPPPRHLPPSDTPGRCEAAAPLCLPHGHPCITILGAQTSSSSTAVLPTTRHHEPPVSLPPRPFTTTAPFLFTVHTHSVNLLPKAAAPNSRPTPVPDPGPDRLCIQGSHCHLATRSHPPLSGPISNPGSHHRPLPVSASKLQKVGGEISKHCRADGRTPQRPARPPASACLSAIWLLRFPGAFPTAAVPNFCYLLEPPSPGAPSPLAPTSDLTSYITEAMAAGQQKLPPRPPPPLQTGSHLIPALWECLWGRHHAPTPPRLLPIRVPALMPPTLLHWLLPPGVHEYPGPNFRRHACTHTHTHAHTTHKHTRSFP